MDGVNFLVDESGNKTAVLIDLRIHGSLWEDFHDVLLAQETHVCASIEEVDSAIADGFRTGKL